MIFKNLNNIEKVIGTLIAIGGFIGMVIGAYSTLHTDEEADREMAIIKMEQAHKHDVVAAELLQVQKNISDNLAYAIQRDNQSDIQRHDREIARLDRDLTAKKYKDEEERQFIIRQIDRIEKMKDELE